MRPTGIVMTDPYWSRRTLYFDALDGLDCVFGVLDIAVPDAGPEHPSSTPPNSDGLAFEPRDTHTCTSWPESPSLRENPDHVRQPGSLQRHIRHEERIGAAAWHRVLLWGVDAERVVDIVVGVEHPSRMKNSNGGWTNWTLRRRELSSGSPNPWSRPLGRKTPERPMVQKRFKTPKKTADFRGRCV